MLSKRQQAPSADVHAYQSHNNQDVIKSIGCLGYSMRIESQDHCCSGKENGDYADHQGTNPDIVLQVHRLQSHVEERALAACFSC